MTLLFHSRTVPSLIGGGARITPAHNPTAHSCILLNPLTYAFSCSPQDRAIAQLEEALASRQRAIEQLIAATSSTEQLNTELQDKDAQVRVLSQGVAVNHQIRRR